MEINKLREEKEQLETQVRDMLESIEMLDSVILKEENREEERKLREAKEEAARINLIQLADLRDDITEKAKRYNALAANCDCNTSLAVLVAGLDYQGNVIPDQDNLESPQYLVEGNHWYPSSANC